jgi:hypothetical protein
VLDDLSLDKIILYNEVLAVMKQLHFLYKEQQFALMRNKIALASRQKSR